MLGLNSLRTAKRIIAGIEAMHMIKKGQTLQWKKSVQNQKEFTHQLFALEPLFCRMKKAFYCSFSEKRKVDKDIHLQFKVESSKIQRHLVYIGTFSFLF